MIEDDDDDILLLTELLYTSMWGKEVWSNGQSAIDDYGDTRLLIWVYYARR